MPAVGWLYLRYASSSDDGADPVSSVGLECRVWIFFYLSPRIGCNETSSRAFCLIERVSDNNIEYNDNNPV